MAYSTLPNAYLLFNEYSTKQIALAIEIDGVDILSNTPLYTRVRYGDGTKYGEQGIVYGGLRKVPGVRDLLMLEGSSLTLAQKIEPEQGRGSISQLTFAFLDKDGYMTQVLSPGIIIDEILGKEVKVRLGFQDISYPDQYFTVFRGRVSSVSVETGRVIIQLSDPNIIRKQQIFYQPKTNLTANINPTDTIISVVTNSDFYQHRLGPSGVYDSSVKLYIKIDDEWMSYDPSGFHTNSFTVTRAQRGTVHANHDIDAEVTQGVELSGHGIDLALKLMLSQGGPWLTGIDIEHIVFTGDPTLGDQPNAIILPSKKNAYDDYGITIGAYLTISGSAYPANNNKFIVQRFGTLFGEPNRIIYVDGPLTKESYSPAVFSAWSQYDTLPTACSVGMSPKEVDIEGHEYFKLTWLSSSENSYRFFITNEQSLKTFLEMELYLPMSAYSLTRLGRCSMGITRPPIADQRLQILDKTNVLDPINVKPTRALNNRKFFNRIDFEWDADDLGNFGSVYKTIDSESITKIGIVSTLPIKSVGARTDLGFESLVKRRTYFFLSRYKRGAVMLNMKVNYGVGTLIEAGDIVAVSDNGDLLIPNFETGGRYIGTQLYEVIGRSLDLKNGTASLELLGNVSANAQDKFATWAPSSLLDFGSTTTVLKIKDSYGALPGSEPLKWADYVGQKIIVRDLDHTVSYEVTLQSQDVIDPYRLTITPALPLPPNAGMIVDVPIYPNSIDTLEASIYKQIHVFWNPQVLIVSGISQTEFTVSPSDAAKFKKDLPIYVHSDDYSVTSFAVEAKISNVVGVNITVDKALGFIPASNQKIELIGFPDGGQPYRWV